MTMFRMGLLGDFKREWFLSSSTGIAPDLLFMLVMLVICILLLNVLIAVVSDKYDFAQTRSRELLLEARLEEVAEFDAMGITRIDLETPFRRILRLGKGVSERLEGELTARLLASGKVEEEVDDEEHVEIEDDEDQWEGRLSAINSMLESESEQANKRAQLMDAKQRAMEALLLKDAERASQQKEAMEARQRTIEEKLDRLVASVREKRESV
jgi:hypothetical protein